MQNQDGLLADAEVEGISSTQASNVDDWENFRDDAIMQQQSSIWAEEAEKIPFVGDKARVKHEYKAQVLFNFAAYF